MTDHDIVDSSFTATIYAPLEKIDLPRWAYSLPDHDYQGCSPAHVAAGATTSPDGKPMSINVEVIGGVLMVQHYVESLGEKHHLLLESVSDLFTPNGRTKIHVLWELSVRAVDGQRCELTNRVHSRATDEFMALLGAQGIPFEAFQTQRQPLSIAHNRQETPEFAASIERFALRG